MLDPCPPGNNADLGAAPMKDLWQVIIRRNIIHYRLRGLVRISNFVLGDIGIHISLSLSSIN